MSKTNTDTQISLPMEPFKVKWCHFSDVHLGYKQYNLYERFRDFGKAFKTVMELSLAENPDFIVISGDLFETYRPPPDAIRQAVEVLDLARKFSVPVYCIPGNHDLSYAKEHRKQGGILGLLDRLGYIKLLKDEPIYHYREGQAIAQITGLWFQGSTTMPKLREVMQEHAGHYTPPPSIPKILVLHAFLDRMFPNSPDVKLGELRHLPFDYVALGHHHGYFYDDEKLQVFNPGSTEHRSSNEWDTKDWLRGHDFDDEQENAEYSTRNFMVVEMIVDPSKAHPNHILEKNIISKQFKVRKKTRHIVRLGKLSRNEAINKMKEAIKAFDEPDACVAIKFIGEIKDGVPLFNIAELTENTQALHYSIDTTHLQPAELPTFVYKNMSPREIHERAIKTRYDLEGEILSLHVDLFETLLETLQEKKNDDEEIISLVESYLDKAKGQRLFSMDEQENETTSDDGKKTKEKERKKTKKTAKPTDLTLDRFTQQ